jgi:hypothetical protein
MRKYQIAATAVAASGLMVIAASAAQAQGAGGEPPPAGVVSATPASGTPHLKASDNNPIQQIRQLVQCGNTMYGVGSFSQIIKGSTTYTPENVSSFQATKPYTVTGWAPNIVGTEGSTSDASDAVNTIAFVNGNCADAYIGGKFTSINGTTVANIAEIDTTTGNVVAGFGTKASGAVQTMVGAGNHLLVGGNFTGVNGDTADPYMVSLSPTTGKSDGFLHLNISGNYQYPGVATNATRVFNQQLSHGGSLDLVEGDFTSVGGLPRQQIFMLNVGGSSASVTGWTSPEWDGSDPSQPYQCVGIEPFYIQAAAWSPDDSAAADANGAYFGGHERFSMNANDCDGLGDGGYNAPGMEGLDPANGNLYVSADGSAGYYSRDRGLGADDMLTTSAGLIASDNQSGSQMCGGPEPIRYLPPALQRLTTI